MWKVKLCLHRTICLLVLHVRKGSYFHPVNSNIFRFPWVPNINLDVEMGSCAGRLFNTGNMNTVLANVSTTTLRIMRGLKLNAMTAERRYPIAVWMSFDDICGFTSSWHCNWTVMTRDNGVHKKYDSGGQNSLGLITLISLWFLLVCCCQVEVTWSAVLVDKRVRLGI